MKCALPAFALVLLLASGALAGIPRVVSYQGRVTDNSGSPVDEGTYTMRFRIYTAQSGGVVLWDSSNQSVQVTGGVFNVLLGESPQPELDLPFDQDYWLLATFAGQDLAPRKRIGSVAYAYMAGGVMPGTLVQGSVTSGTLSALKASNTAPTGSVCGIQGESTSTDGMGVYGAATATAGTNYGGKFYSASTSGRGICAYASATTGTNYGGRFHSASPSGAGVYGWASATTGANYGGRFQSHSTSGRGVYAVASATTGSNYGGRFQTYSSAGRGLYGGAVSGSGTSYGVHGESAGSLGRGVYGAATCAIGCTFGVLGESASSLGTGVMGVTTSTAGENNGVIGQTASTSTYAAGVLGLADASSGGACGVRGESTAPTGRGVYGAGYTAGGDFEDATSSTYGLVAFSTYKISGNGACSFVQNHPYDSEYVVSYACPEGDEVATYTRGTARLVAGEARVSLGETFKWVTNPDIGLTAHLTPRGSGSVLFVESLTTTELVVRSMEGFPSDIAFDYVVYGLRIGFEEVSIVQAKEREAHIPSMEDHRKAYAERPDLRRHNALERFKRMAAAAGLEGSVDITSSRALRDAIKESDPAVKGPVSSERLVEMRRLMQEERRRLEEERMCNEREHGRMTAAVESCSPVSQLGD